MRSTQLVIALAGLTLLAACESTPIAKQDVGVATGMVLGEAPGPQVAGRPTAALGGGWASVAFLDSRVGAQMDRNDQLKTAQALETLGDGRATTWHNRHTGQHFTVTATRTYEGAAGPCREFAAVTEIDGHRELAHGVACKQQDGRWRTV